MIESITVTNYLGESIEMVLTQPELSGFIVKSIDGIGPANANINMMELATIDGSIFNSARLNTRDISLSLLFIQNPDIGINNIEEARRLSYKYFPIKRQVKITFKTDAALGEHNPIHAIGYVEKNEPKVFQKQEGTSITIKCADPYLHSERMTNKIFYGVDPLFEFVYENKEPDQKLTEFGNINFLTEGEIIYDGDAETGMVIEMHARGPAKGVVFYDNESGERIELSDAIIKKKTGNYISTGDTITINTERGNKYCRLLRNGRTYDILNALVKPLSWFKLNSGSNIFGYEAAEGLENLIFTIKYDVLYDGV